MKKVLLVAILAVAMGGLPGVAPAEAPRAPAEKEGEQTTALKIQIDFLLDEVSELKNQHKDEVKKRGGEIAKLRADMQNKAKQRDEEIAKLKAEAKLMRNQHKDVINPIGRELRELKNQVARLESRQPCFGEVSLYYTQPGLGWTLSSDVKLPGCLREFKTKIKFEASKFHKPPKVMVAIKSIEAMPCTRLKVEALDVTSEDFTIKISVWGDTKLYLLQFLYVAVPQP